MKIEVPLNNFRSNWLRSLYEAVRWPRKISSLIGSIYVMITSGASQLRANQCMEDDDEQRNWTSGCTNHGPLGIIYWHSYEEGDKNCMVLAV